jgi:hypothetical protein
MHTTVIGVLGPTGSYNPKSTSSWVHRNLFSRCQRVPGSTGSCSPDVNESLIPLEVAFPKVNECLCPLEVVLSTSSPPEVAFPKVNECLDPPEVVSLVSITQYGSTNQTVGSSSSYFEVILLIWMSKRYYTDWTVWNAWLRVKFTCSGRINILRSDVISQLIRVWKSGKARVSNCTTEESPWTFRWGWDNSLRCGDVSLPRRHGTQEAEPAVLTDRQRSLNVCGPSPKLNLTLRKYCKKKDVAIFWDMMPFL